MICQECDEPLTGLRRKFCSKKCVNLDYQRRNRESLNRRKRVRYREDPAFRARHIELVKKRNLRIREEEEGLLRRLRKWRDKVAERPVDYDDEDEEDDEEEEE